MNARTTLAGLLLLALADVAPAANLDKALLKASGTLLESLADEGVRTVGVLPFRVRSGARPAGYDAAPLAASLPGRLENALILGQGSDEAKAVRVVRDAPGSIAQAGIGPWPSDRLSFRRLFSARYRLAWGDQRVKPDGFLTGLVVRDASGRHATVEIGLLTYESWKGGKPVPKVLKKLKVAVDGSLLRDLGYCYVLPRAAAQARGVKPRDLDAQAVRQAIREEEGAAAPHSFADIAGMRFEIEYDGVKQRIAPLATSAKARQPLFQVPAAKPGQKVVMYLTRIADDDAKLGVVLSLNGQSLYEQQDGDKIACKKWIYAPGRKVRDDFAGFYRRGAGKKLDVTRFKPLTAEESKEKAAQMGGRAGWIDIDVFVSGSAPRPSTSGEEEEEGEMLFSTRGATRARGRTLKQVQQAIAKANNIKLVEPAVKPRSAAGLLFMEAKPSDTASYTSDELPNPRQVGGISIRSYQQDRKDKD